VFAYIVRRLALMLVTLIGISIIIFVLLRVVPGNIVDILFDAAGFVDPADKANLEKELGLNLPIVVQYFNWISGLLHGDLGYSYVSEKPALQEILPRIPITARLAGLALLFSASIGIPLGVISAVHQGTRLDYTLRVVSLSGLSLPSFWLGLLILMVLLGLVGCSGGRDHHAAPVDAPADRGDAQSRKFLNCSGIPKSSALSFAITACRSSFFFPDTRS